MQTKKFLSLVTLIAAFLITFPSYSGLVYPQQQGAQQPISQATLSELLNAYRIGSIMIGAGIPSLPEHSVLFEKVMNLIHFSAPLSKIGFNTRPADTLQAMQRWTRE